MIGSGTHQIGGSACAAHKHWIDETFVGILSFFINNIKQSKIKRAILFEIYFENFYFISVRGCVEIRCIIGIYISGCCGDVQRLLPYVGINVSYSRACSGIESCGKVIDFASSAYLFSIYHIACVRILTFLQTIIIRNPGQRIL